MRTPNSINLEMPHGSCWALLRGTCSASTEQKEDDCCTYRCPFYKPKDCEDWIRIEDKQGINLIPPEEYYDKRNAKSKLPQGYSFWRIVRRRAPQ